MAREDDTKVSSHEGLIVNRKDSDHGVASTGSVACSSKPPPSLNHLSAVAALAESSDTLLQITIAPVVYYRALLKTGGCRRHFSNSPSAALCNPAIQAPKKCGARLDRTLWCRDEQVRSP